MALCPETPIASLLNRPVDKFSDEEIRNMWYDWFCKDTSLVNKGRKLLKRLQGITPSPRFDAKNTYVFFKNNCPADGHLYDSFSICKIGSGDVLYWVAPKLGYRNFLPRMACISGPDPETGEFGDIIVGTWWDVMAFFRASPEKARQMIQETKRFLMIYKAERENAQLDSEKKLAELHTKWDKQAEGREYREQIEYLLNR